MVGRKQMEEISVEINEVPKEDKEKGCGHEEDVKAEGGKTREGKSRDIQTHATSSEKPKQNVKPKNTIPQPFSLATERRKSRERRASVDFEEAKPDISRSFNSKVLSRTWNGTERISAQNLAAKSTSRTIKTTLPPPRIASTHEPVEKMVKNIVPKPMTKSQVLKETQKEKPQINKKQEEGGMESKKITFKAKPLPGFYQEKGRHRSSNSDIQTVGKERKVLPKSEGNNGKPVKSTVINIGKRTVNKLAKPYGESSSGKILNWRSGIKKRCLHDL